MNMFGHIKSNPLIRLKQIVSKEGTLPRSMAALFPDRDVLRRCPKL